MWKWLEDHALNQLHALAGFVAKHGPPWLPHAARIALAILTSLLTLIVAIESLVRARKAIRDFLPGFTEAERLRNERRRKLCTLLENRMDALNRAVQWSDETYTDLEAEVESEGRRFYRSFLFKLFPQRSDLRREKSLASAIANTGERLVVLEGPAGCGKTVALRHVVLKLARAAESWSNRKPVALYVNLKTLARRPDEPVNAALIEKPFAVTPTSSDTRTSILSSPTS